MQKLLIITLVAGMTFPVWIRQRTRLEAVVVQNERLASVAAELKARTQRAESARQAAQEKLAKLREELKVSSAAKPDIGVQTVSRQIAVPAEPDPSHQGGWPASAAFFYLPKQVLTNASYRLLNGDRLTDEAAALLGMSATEREATDRVFGELLDQFHRVEIQHMQSVTPPAGWVAPNPLGSSGLQFDSALTYRIPDLTEEISSARQNLLDQLQQTLGASRARIIGSAADAFIRQNLDDLGAGDRIVGFVWQKEPDGTHSLWYAMADARHGEGFFQRVPQDLDPNSQTAYYARLFGVQLPGH